MKEKNTAKKQQNEQLKLVDNVTKTYINNNSKNLKKIAEKLGNPDKFEELYREGCLNVFGTNVADQTISNIVHGNPQIKSMKTYQNSINDFVIHDMAMIMADRNYVIPRILLQIALLLSSRMHLTGLDILLQMEMVLSIRSIRMRMEIL